MSLNPIAQEIINAFPVDEVSELTPDDFRLTVDEGAAAVEREEVDEIEDRNLVGADGQDLPIRLYRPKGVQNPAPITVFFHGGGWVVGGLLSHDAECRALSNQTRTVLIAVDYRLAPEHPFPAAPEDCYTALCQIVELADELGIDPNRLAVMGDSAGGNLATVVCLMSRDRSGPKICHQLLIYPACDIDPDRWPSIKENSTGYLLTEEMMRWFYRHYVGAETFLDEAYASPIRANDLSGLPSAQVITAEFDPLRDEGEAYAQALSDAGVQTYYECAPGLIHGFLGFAEMIPEAKEVRNAACKRLVEALQ